MDLGSAIKELREKKELTQKYVSYAAGISVNALSLIETNKTFPKQETIKAICKAIEVPVAYLLFFTLTEDDVPEQKRLAFKLLQPVIARLLSE